jgi:hypothetical protein
MKKERPTKPTKPTVPVRIANTAGHTIDIAPGEKYADIPPDKLPKVGIVRWIPCGDGTYRPRLQVMENWIRTTHAPQFGIHIQPETLVRLANSGFIQIAQTSPGHNAINLESLLDHIEACRDPEFWTSARKATYRRAFWNFRNSDE